MNRKPAVYIYEAKANPMDINEICAGLEEESVPFAVYSCGMGEVGVLAYDAAGDSPLRVGVGVCEGAAALQMGDLAVDNPVFLVELASAELRKLGTNAARAVKGGVFV